MMRKALGDSDIRRIPSSGHATFWAEVLHLNDPLAAPILKLGERNRFCTRLSKTLLYEDRGRPDCLGYSQKTKSLGRPPQEGWQGTRDPEAA